MNAIIENPWKGLSEEAPFIAKIDEPFFNNNRKVLSHLELKVYPDAFLGNFEKAEVVFLLLNPGFQKRDLTTYMKDPIYVAKNKESLLEQTEDFYVLNFEYSGGYLWWRRILKAIIVRGISIDELKQKIFCVQLFPYHSIKYKHINRELPSQAYSLQLVRKAIAQNKKIVLMRSEQLWLKAIPELTGKYIKVRNPRNPAISKKNMNPKDFEEIYRLLS